MAIEVVVPRLGWSMDEGAFGEWLKRDGEWVEQGQALFVLEGEKSAQDIESFDAGILRIPPGAPGPGDTVKVGQVLAYLCAKDESPPFGADAKPQSPAKADSPREAVVATVVIEAKEKSAPHSSGAKASPRARRRAAKLGIDWTALNGTGRKGRVRERDVVAAAKSGSVRASAQSDKKSDDARRALAISRLRKTIASRMMSGAHDTAPVTLTMRCDATNLVGLRNQFRAGGRDSDGVVPDYNDLIVKLTAAALERHPLLTARWTEREIAFAAQLDVAVAVDTESGLLAPVIRNASGLSLREVSAEMRRLVKAARDGELSEGDLQGGVFTITNLGMFGIDAFTPIINLPQVAILGVGAIVREPVVIDDQVVIRNRLTLSLTIDHRVVDGAPAARFLAELRQAIEQPGPWLVQ